MATVTAWTLRMFFYNFIFQVDWISIKFQLNLTDGWTEQQVERETTHAAPQSDETRSHCRHRLRPLLASLLGFSSKFFFYLTLNVICPKDLNENVFFFDWWHRIGFADLHSSEIVTVALDGDHLLISRLSWLLEFGRQSHSLCFLVRQLQEKLYESLRLRCPTRCQQGSHRRK